MMQRALISATIEKSRLAGVTEMTQERVGDMSVQELIQLIETTIDQRIRAGKPMPYRLSGDRPLAEIIQEMRDLRIKREPGEPSVIDMIREERER